jgi:hypothetical protein
MILAENNPGVSPVLFVWLLVVAALVFVGYLMISWLRKGLTGDDTDSAPAGFTLSDLRELHRTGKMTTEEFERAKTQMVATIQAAMARKEKERKREGP